jgi:CheY-like chemotaxis protein
MVTSVERIGATCEHAMKHTVLVIEDEAPLRDLMREALELSGYDVVAAGNGREALEAMGEIEHVCLVLLDLLMPVMDGWEFFSELQSRPTLATVPVVVHTSEPRQAPEGVRVLQKPIKLDRLLAVVHEYCAAN